jgi:DNA repair exonuclease SbcCD ATPase subunit
MEKSKVSPNTIKKTIFEEAKRIKRKEELYEEVKKIEKELNQINESSAGMAGSFGFVGDKSDNHKHGFVDNQFQNISNIARLEQEFSEKEDNKKEINEEVATLKAKIEELEAQLKESKSK